METEGLLVVLTNFNQVVILNATLNLWIYVKKHGKSRAGNWITCRLNVDLGLGY
jgi:hypothetical protein